MLNDLIALAVKEFNGIPLDWAAVHKSTTLPVLADRLLELGILIAPKKRRQGKQGAASARNYLLRKALWYARFSSKVDHDVSRWQDLEGLEDF